MHVLSIVNCLHIIATEQIPYHILTVCDPRIATLLSWDTIDELHDSDQFPILIETYTAISQEINLVCWNLKQANGKVFTENLAQDFDPITGCNIDELVSAFTKKLFAAAEKHIGRRKTLNKKKVVP
ncbi:hypothetical protein HHI36_003055 [Cryptolaemus montrouzieri]|uniref:Uncharacterized protein n=1 Tax=Cryptolaemus montrouzieri TaxID=559131 RepID=A0ABD2PCB4_9CUCU